jgi:surface antigen
MTISNLLFVTFLLAVLAAPVTAQNIGFLHKGPVAYLSEDEKDKLKETVSSALNNAVDGETVEWSNPDSESEGPITVRDTHTDYATTCRSIRTVSKAGGREGGGVYRLCKAEDDCWRFATSRRSATPCA